MTYRTSQMLIHKPTHTILWMICTDPERERVGEKNAHSKWNGRVFDIEFPLLAQEIKRVGFTHHHHFLAEVVLASHLPHLAASEFGFSTLPSPKLYDLGFFIFVFLPGMLEYFFYNKY